MLWSLHERSGIVDEQIYMQVYIGTLKKTVTVNVIVQRAFVIGICARAVRSRTYMCLRICA